MIKDEDIKKMKDDFKHLQKEIESAVNIIIYRHQSPDFDALGAQMGLYNWIKENYPLKKVYYVGDRHPDYMPELFPFPMEISDDIYNESHLAIVVDTANVSRISENHIDLAKKVIKIDHHPLPSGEDQRFGDLNLIYSNRPAASEIIALFMLSRNRKFKISQETARCLYCGIIGDTGKFSYQDTDGATLRIAADLLDRGVDISKLCRDMYCEDENKFEILKYCLNNYKKTDAGCYYYILEKDTMDKLKMTVDNGNLYINKFRELKDCKVACSITWDEKNNHYRISLRSAEIKVDPISIKYHGGGHDYACGCHLKSLDQLNGFLHDVDLLIEGKFDSSF